MSFSVDKRRQFQPLTVKQLEKHLGTDDPALAALRKVAGPDEKVQLDELLSARDGKITRSYMYAVGREYPSLLEKIGLVDYSPVGFMGRLGVAAALTGVSLAGAVTFPASFPLALAALVSAVPTLAMGRAAVGDLVDVVLGRGALPEERDAMRERALTLLPDGHVKKLRSLLDS